MDIRKSKTHTNERFADQHRFEHWYRDNQVYFITATVRDHAHAFATEEAKHVFWTQWEKYTKEFEYTSWVTSLMNNHYHDLGYNKHADNLPVMMQRIHGSVAKLTNGLLDVRIAPFWIDHGKQNYFDGCIRDVLQCERCVSVHVLAEREAPDLLRPVAIPAHACSDRSRCWNQASC